MKTVLIVCFNDLKSDARVTRQINFLKSRYQLTVACFDAYEDPAYELFRVKKTKLSFFRKAASSLFLLMGINKVAYNILYNYKTYIGTLSARGFDLVLANDIEALPFAFEVAGQHSKVYFDAHEYAPRQFEDRLYWRIFFRRFVNALCRKYIPRVNGMCTINQAIANAYKTQFGINCIVITNASDYVDLVPGTHDQGPIRLVHHGIFNRSRQPHIMVDMMKLLDERFTLDLIYLLPHPASPQTIEYFEKFKAEAEATGKIKILPALKASEIVTALHAHYDMGIILIPPVNFNYENGLPNKLFDCIQARIGIAAGPLKEIARIVNQYEIGVVSESFTAHDMAKTLNNLLLEDVHRFKQNTQLAAQEMNARHNQQLLLADIERVLNQ